MPFLSLPNELILLIAKHLSLDLDAYTISSLTQTNRRLAFLLTRHLNQLAVSCPAIIKSSSVLIWAAEHGNEGLARLALEKTSKAATRSHGQPQYTALHWAAMAEHGGEAVVKVLLDYGADVAAVTFCNRTPLHCAAMHGRDQSTKLLLDGGANPNALEDVMFHGRVTPLYWAAKRGHHNTVKVLLENGAEISYSGANSDRQYILHWATRHRNLVILHLLLENGADISARNRDGDTALHWAAKDNRDAAVQVLLDRGADPVAQNLRGETPLHLAIIGKNKLTIKAILDHGTDSKTWSTATNAPSTSGYKGYKALHLATTSGRCAIFELLLRYGADINVRTDSTHTVLHLAAIDGDEVMVSHVLSKGIEIDVLDAEGNTALHCAVLRGKTRVVRLLMRNGADASIVNIQGRTVYQLERPRGQWEVGRRFDEALKAVWKEQSGHGFLGNHSR